MTRADCINGPRPCPWTKCKYHLSGKVGCVLDMVDLHPDGGTLTEVAEALNLTKERVRQLELQALAKCREAWEIGYD